MKGQHTPIETQRQAVQEAQAQDADLGQIAKKYSIKPSTLKTWIRRVPARAAASGNGRAKVKVENIKSPTLLVRLRSLPETYEELLEQHVLLLIEHDRMVNGG